jgi:capsular polysaccharide biosynthesis protein
MYAFAAWQLKIMADQPTPLPLPSRDMLLRLPNATVTRAIVDRETKSTRGAVYDAEGALVAASNRHPHSYRSCDPDTLPSGTVGRHLQRAIYLGHAFRHFGHFLLETIPALCWVREVDAAMPLLFHAFDKTAQRNVFTQTPYGAECLRLLGIAPDRIVLATSDIAVADLLLSPRAYQIGRGPNYDFRSVYHALRDAAQRDSRSTAQRVYLSRRRLRGRRHPQRLAAEGAIERHMKRRGFEVLYPESIRFGDQIRVVAGADIVAGVDGSALHLSAFMRPGSRMLVLETQRRADILALNAFMGVETTAIKAVRPTDGPAQPSIDPAQLDAALDHLGCPPVSGVIRRLFDTLFR